LISRTLVGAESSECDQQNDEQNISFGELHLIFNRQAAHNQIGMLRNKFFGVGLL
jgi:hypothetical protein